MSKEQKLSPRKPWIAGLLTLLMPGLGYIYNGHFKKGLMTYAMIILFFIVGLISMLVPIIYPLNAIFLYIVIPLIIIVLIKDSVKGTKEISYKYELKKFNRWYYYLFLFVVNAYLVTPFIFGTLKTNFVEFYFIPNGAMANTIKTGDFIVGNKLVAARSNIFRGDVIIFKFPRDVHQKFIKRCVAGPGDEIQVRNQDLYVNGDLSPLPENGKYIGPVYSESDIQKGIFLGSQGNKDFFHSLIIPRKGDIINVSPENAILLLHLMLLDGHEITLKTRSKTYTFTMVSPAELARRKGVSADNKYYPFGNLLNPWSSNFPSGTLLIDGSPVQELSEYIVEQNYFWAMGDNRDDSLDSRYWGFVPESHILGKALFIYFSLDLETWIPRFNRLGTIIQ